MCQFYQSLGVAFTVSFKTFLASLLVTSPVLKLVGVLFHSLALLDLKDLGSFAVPKVGPLLELLSNWYWSIIELQLWDALLISCSTALAPMWFTLVELHWFKRSVLLTWSDILFPRITLIASYCKTCSLLILPDGVSVLSTWISPARYTDPQYLM